MALVTTIGSASANSYGDVSGATTYFTLTRRKDEWDAVANLSALAQEQALFDAMLFIEAQDYLGSRADTTQALQWPRKSSLSRLNVTTTTGVIDQRGRTWTDTEIPDPVVYAQYEQALALTQSEHWLNGRYQSQSVTAGQTTVEIATQSKLGRLCRAAELLLDGLVLTGGSIHRLVRA